MECLPKMSVERIERFSMRFNCAIILNDGVLGLMAQWSRILSRLFMYNNHLYLPQPAQENGFEFYSDWSNLGRPVPVRDQVSWPAFVYPVSSIDRDTHNGESYGTESCDRGSDARAGSVADDRCALLRVLNGDYSVLCLWHGRQSGGDLRDKL